MLYIEAILAHNDVECPFRVDADNMRELMYKTLQIINNLIIDADCAFNVIAFDSNTLSEHNFTKLIDIYLEMQD